MYWGVDVGNLLTRFPFGSWGGRTSIKITILTVKLKLQTLKTFELLALYSMCVLIALCVLFALLGDC